MAPCSHVAGALVLMVLPLVVVATAAAGSPAPHPQPPPHAAPPPTVRAAVQALSGRTFRCADFGQNISSFWQVRHPPPAF